MIIYIIRNKINRKVYIGQTNSTLQKRFSQHCEKRNTTVIGNAIKKYGKHKFIISVLNDDIDSRKTANRKEIYYIKKYNTLAPQVYNIEK